MKEGESQNDNAQIKEKSESKSEIVFKKKQ
jgi:hypothetical protein